MHRLVEALSVALLLAASLAHAGSSVSYPPSVATTGLQTLSGISACTGRAGTQWIDSADGTLEYCILNDASAPLIGGAGSGEANTIASLGGGLAVAAGKVGAELRTVSLAGADFDLVANLVTLDAAIARLNAPIFTGTPTIPAAGWVNMNHNHQAAAEGGQLNAEFAFSGASGKIPAALIPTEYITAAGVNWGNICFTGGCGFGATQFPIGSLVAPKDSPTFTTIANLPSSWTLGGTAITVPASTLNFATNVTSDIQTQIDSKLASNATNPRIRVCPFYFEVPVAGDDGGMKCAIPSGATIKYVYCHTNTGGGTQRLNLYDRSRSTPNTGTTELIPDIDCGENGAESATLSVSVATRRLVTIGLQTPFTTGFVAGFIEYELN